MGKFRSKLKRNVNGKRWAKGHSSTSNPETLQHRLKAKSRFFQPNLSLAPQTQSDKQSGLTLDAVLKHEQRERYKNGESGDHEPTINDVAISLKSCNITNNDETMSKYTDGTFKTFATNYSNCTNISFKKLLVGFRVTSDLHKEMLAILTALTEIIKERGGKESSTEYFILLMETIEASTEDKDIIAGISLLGMGIKTVPSAVLRKRFSETAQTLITCLHRFIDSVNQPVIRYIIGCLAVLLRAQDYATWSYSSNWQYIDAILSFCIHAKPKIRKAAQHAIVSIIHGSTFMLNKKQTTEDDGNAETNIKSQIKFHPAGSRVVTFCLRQFDPETLVNSQTTVLHTLTLLKDTLNGFKSEDIRSICESLLSIMTAANVLIRTTCFHVLHSFFISNTENVNGELCAKLLAAIYEYRPDRTDVRQTLAWLTVLKAGHMHLAKLDLGLCLSSLPRLIEIFSTDLWMSDRSEITNSVSNAIKELLEDCVKPACSTQELADQHRHSISRIISLLSKVLAAPFGDIAKHVIVMFSAIFEICGNYYREELATGLTILFNRYDTQSSLRIQIEHSIVAAVKSMSPEYVLKVIPLTDSKGEMSLEKSWLLPLMREGATGASLKFFRDVILPLALDCNKKWKTYTEEKQISLSHTYELLCCQLWGLFPGFCRNPKDPKNFQLLAQTLGFAIDNNPEFHPPIFDGFLELISNTEMHEILAKFSKNFLPRLFNVYTVKPSGTYEVDLRKKALDVIKNYLSITPEPILKELHETAYAQLEKITPGTFEYDSMYDITSALVCFQTAETIKTFFEKYIDIILSNKKSKLVSKDEQKLKKQQRKSYELLSDILTSDNTHCKKFVRKNAVTIEKTLLEAFATSCSVCQAARLRCLKNIIENRKTISINDKIIAKTIPEAVISFKQFSTRKERISEEIIIFIANLYQEANKLNDFIDILTAGFAGDESLITNTILAFRAIVQNFGKHLTVNTIQYILEQISVFLVQKSRMQAEASIIFLITAIKVMPSPLLANHLETIMKSLSAMVKDTKRYSRIQIGYLLMKLCKRFSAEELIKFVPGDDEVTHRRLKKIRKQLRRETRKKLDAEKKADDDSESEPEFGSDLKAKSETIDDILGDSDSDLPDDMDDHDDKSDKKRKKSKKNPDTFIREDPEEVVDLADIKSIGNILTNRPNTKSSFETKGKNKTKDVNRGFKTAEDGRLIISDKCNNESSSDDSDDNEEKGNEGKIEKKIATNHSSDEEEKATSTIANTRKRKATDSISMKSGKTSNSRYTAGGKGIHRPLSGAPGSTYSSKASKSTALVGAEYSCKKAKGDMKKKGKLDPYAYIPMSRNTLNKRKRAKHNGMFKNIVKGARKGSLKGVKSRIQKTYKK